MKCLSSLWSWTPDHGPWRSQPVAMVKKRCEGVVAAKLNTTPFKGGSAMTDHVANGVSQPPSGNDDDDDAVPFPGSDQVNSKLLSNLCCMVRFSYIVLEILWFKSQTPSTRVFCSVCRV